jgi:hypothetical protein
MDDTAEAAALGPIASELSPLAVLLAPNAEALVFVEDEL